MFSLILFSLALWVGYRALQGYLQVSGLKQWRDDELARTKLILEKHPSNSGARAKLAEFLIEDGELEAGIHEYRTAIGQTPMGPFTTEWKRKLKAALEVQEILARGEKVPGFNEWRVCEKCHATTAVNAKSCPKCGNTLNKSFGEWFLNSGTQKDIWRQALPLALVLWICGIVFTALPIEWKGMIVVSSTLVGGWLILRSMDI